MVVKTWILQKRLRDTLYELLLLERDIYGVDISMVQSELTPIISELTQIIKNMEVDSHA